MHQRYPHCVLCLPCWWSSVFHGACFYGEVVSQLLSGEYVHRSVSWQTFLVLQTKWVYFFNSWPLLVSCIFNISEHSHFKTFPLCFVHAMGRCWNNSACLFLVNFVDFWGSGDTHSIIFFNEFSVALMDSENNVMEMTCCQPSQTSVSSIGNKRYCSHELCIFFRSPWTFPCVISLLS